MANDFSGDNSCKALWSFESGALTTDSKSTNTLTNNGADEEPTNHMEGSCGAAFVSATPLPEYPGRQPGCRVSLKKR